MKTRTTDGTDATDEITRATRATHTVLPSELSVSSVVKMSGSMRAHGMFYGIGVGPGEPGLLPVAAWRALQACDVIFAPRAESAEASAARECLRGFEIAEEKFREIVFKMSPNRDVLRTHYRELAEVIAAELRAG